MSSVTYTLSRLSRIWRKLSQLSHPSLSNCSIVLISEHDRHARSWRKSFGIESAILSQNVLILLSIYFEISEKVNSI